MTAADWVIRFLKGATAARRLYTPENAEPVWDTDLQQLFVGDNSQAGGVRAGIATHPGLATGGGAVLMPANYFGTGQVVAVAADVMYLMPFAVVAKVAIASMQFRVTGADAGQSVRMGIYSNDDAQGKPLTLLGETAAQAATPVSTIDVAMALTLSPGWYWGAFVTDAGAATFVCAHNSDRNFMSVMWPDKIGNTVYAFSQAHTFGALPAIGTLTSEGSGTALRPPLVALKPS